MPKIGVIIPKINGKTYHRLQVPFAYHPEAVTFDGFDMDKNKPTDYDVLILNGYFLQPIELLIHAKQQGVKIVLDIDDWIRVPKLDTRYYDLILQQIELADVVWVASKKLYKELGNKKTYYIPNALDLSQPQWNCPHEPDYDVVWGGGVTHQRDINRFVKDVKFVNGLYVGIKGQSNDKATYHDGLAPDVYGQIFAKGDIGIAPVANTTFNSFKSNIKALEIAAYKLPFVCSDVAPYQDVPTPFKCETKNEWMEAIRRLKREPNLRQEQGQIMYEWMRNNHDLNTINQFRWQTFL